MEIIKSDIDKIDICSITTDGWTSIQQYGYMSLTVHYINDNFQLISRTVSIENLTGSHTGEAIQVAIRELLKKWEIYKKTECATTDNGKFY